MTVVPMSAPRLTPRVRIKVIRPARMARIWLQADFLMPSLNLSMPYRNRAKPPKSPIIRNPQDILAGVAPAANTVWAGKIVKIATHNKILRCSNFMVFVLCSALLHSK